METEGVQEVAEKVEGEKRKKWGRGILQRCVIFRDRKSAKRREATKIRREPGSN